MSPDWVSAIASWVGAIATTIAVIVAIKALLYAKVQLQSAKEAVQSAKEAAQATRDAVIAASRNTEGQFLLQIEQLLRMHWSVHVRLRPGGEWTGPKAGPKRAEEWAEVDHYMGLFERMHLLADRGTLDPGYIARFYGYRINNIWKNDIIRKRKLRDEAAYWHDFIALSRLVVEYYSDVPRFTAIEDGLQGLN